MFVAPGLGVCGRGKNTLINNFISDNTFFHAKFLNSEVCLVCATFCDFFQDEKTFLEACVYNPL